MICDEECITIKTHYVEVLHGVAIQRYEVTNAPDRCAVSLALLAASNGSIRCDSDVLWIGFPAEEEVGYRVTGVTDDRLALTVEKL